MPSQTDRSGLRRLDLSPLSVIAALMRERSVTRAGQGPFLSRPAPSAVPGRLREALEDEPLARNGRALEPMARAAALMAELKPWLLDAAPPKPAAASEAALGAPPGWCWPPLASFRPVIDKC